MDQPRRTRLIWLLGLAFAGCGGTIQPPPTPTSAAQAPLVHHLGTASVAGDSLTATFDVVNPVHCPGSPESADWPPLCVVLQLGEMTLAGRVDYRPEVTHIDEDEVWVRTYNGALAGDRGLTWTAVAHARLTTPMGMAAAHADRERGTVSVTLRGLPESAQGATVSVALVDRLPLGASGGVGQVGQGGL